MLELAFDEVLLEATGQDEANHASLSLACSLKVHNIELL